MPTTRFRNLLYRAALPYMAPAVPKDALLSVTGRQLAVPERLNSIIHRNHISGSVVCLQSDSDISFAFSKAIHTRMAPNAQTFFRVASITKTATALLCFVLIDRGILDPGKPVSEMLDNGSDIPELKNVRIHHLLSHTSGITDPPDLEARTLAHCDLKSILAGTGKSEPGECFRYSNLGYGLLGCIFETILHVSVEDVYQRFLFKPLCMNATLSAALLPEDSIMPVIRILPYHAGTGITVTPLGKHPVSMPDPAYHYGYTAGSMYTDIGSMLNLTVCLRNGGKPLLSDHYANVMKQKKAYYGKRYPTLSYGQGLLIIEDKRISESIVFGHQGFAYGCVDGAFWEDSTGNIMISLNGGCSEARNGMLGIANMDLCRWAFREELPEWR